MTRRALSDRTAVRSYNHVHGRRLQRPEGWLLHLVPTRVDGVTLDAEEASVLFADEPWAARAKYLGLSRGMHVFARPPEGARR